MDQPTLSPSYLTGTNNFTDNRCHSYIKEGMIQFLGDSHHALRGETVKLLDWDDL